jgi:hypothetical protein
LIVGLVAAVHMKDGAVAEMYVTLNINSSSSNYDTIHDDGVAPEFHRNVRIVTVTP